MVKIIEANSQDMFIDNIELFKQIPKVVESWQTLYAKCILRQYRTFFGYDENNKIVGVVFFSTKKGPRKSAHICGFSAKNQASKFVDKFYAILKAQGYESVTSNSNLNEQAYERVIKLKKIYSVYHKNL